ncbi:MAG TPA: hypothetical protein PLI31_00720 [Methanoregulaceae archaeon]|nr:hypothetical protein [Methanoregulaceae archaeon]
MTHVFESLQSPAFKGSMLVLICLVAITFIVPVSSAEESVLFTTKNSSITAFHQDLLATGNLTRMDAARVLNEWSSCLNLTGPIVENIRDKDFTAADEGIRSFVRSREALSDLATQLGLKDTEIGTFLDENDAVLWSLRKLAEQISAYEELRDEQILLQNGNDVAALKSLELRGDDLRSEIRWNYQDYVESSAEIINISRRFGRDTSELERSILDFAALLAEINIEQDRRQTKIPERIQEIQAEWCASRSGLCLPPSAISLTVLPTRGHYGDTLHLNGTVLAAPGTDVNVFIDGRLIGSVKTDGSRHFSLPYRIEKGRAGSHAAYASLDMLLSKIVNFSIGKANTSISLDATVTMENGTWMALGTGRLVTEGGVPVEGARVYIDVDGRPAWATGITGKDGKYSITTGEIPAGDRTLTAWFESDEYPLEGCESSSVTVEIPSKLGWPPSIIYMLGVGGAVLGSVFFLRKRRPEEAPSPNVLTMVVPERTITRPPPPSLEEAMKMADDAVVTIGDRIDGRMTIIEMYRRLVFEMEKRTPGCHLRTETPRKVAEIFANTPYGRHLALLVGIHERVQYAEDDATDDDLRTTREAFIAVLREGAED